MENQPGQDSVTDQSQAALLHVCSLLNGSDPSSLASSLAQLPEAKNLLSQILSNTSTSQTNLQQVLSAVSMVTQQQQQQQQQQRPLKPTNMSPASQPQVVTTPTQSMPTTGRKRGRPPSTDQDESLRKRRGGYSAGRVGGGPGEKQSKGLRHFSQLVCEKVREKGITSYNEVADELVRELDEQEQRTGTEMQIDQKNIRRRVYDALNVLMAMNIISKEKKEIRWIGLPTNSVQECEHIQTELTQYEERIARKKSELHELVLQILTLKNLMKRNREKADTGDPPTPNSAIGLPFILVNTNKNTVIDCSISSDKSEYVFNFDNTFELHQDVDILKKMGLDCGLHSGESTPESLELAKSLLPKTLEPVLDEMAEVSALVLSSVPVTSQSSVVQDDHTPSTPLSSDPAPLSTTVHTPSLQTDNGPSYSSSPLALPTSIDSSSPCQQQLAAAISSLQHLQHISSMSNGGGVASPSTASTPALPTPSIVPPAMSPSGSSITLPGSSVTARPLPSPKPSLVPASPLLKAQLPSTAGGATPTPGGAAMTPGRSPKVVTVQQLTGNASVADIIASLQHNVSNLLKQQQSSGGTLMPSSSTHTLSSLLNSLQQQQQQNSQKAIANDILDSPSAGAVLSSNSTNT